MTFRFTALILLAAALLTFACSSDNGAARGSGPSGVIAFGAEGPEGDGLYIVKPDGSGLTMLTAESGDVAYSVWSPGGGRIDQLPAGAAFGEVILIIALVVLLVALTDYLGITNVFPWIEPRDQPSQL